MSTRKALILVGHGSHLNGDSSAPVYQHAQRLRDSGAFDEVVEAFWKEEPCLRDALDLVDADEVFVVPLFLAEGYFTREVLPRELGIDGPITRRGGRVIHYCSPVGTHPSLAAMILRRARAVDGLTEEARRRAALVVIGHGTERSTTSGDTVYSLVERLRQEAEFATVSCGFLDEEPSIASVVETIDATDILLVPFFVAEGWHTRETIPADLGLTGARTVREERTIWYAAPVGTLPEIADLILEITAERSSAGEGVGTESPGSPSPSPSLAAREAFFEWVCAGGEIGRTFLQVAIRPEGDGRFALLHRDDAGPARGSLDSLTSLDRREDPRDALGIARFAAGGEYRPLRSAGDLRRGWIFRALDADGLWTVLSLLYPAAVVNWHRHATGDLEVLSYEQWAGRQTAMYAELRHLEPGAVAEVVDSLCGGCLRSRLWRVDAGDRDGPAITLPTEAMCIPCREPCTLFATRARQGG